MLNIRPITQEHRTAFYGEKQIKGTQQGEIVQQACDMFADKKQTRMFLGRCEEEGILPAKGIRKYYEIQPDVPVLTYILRDIGIDFNIHTLGDIVGGDITLESLNSKRQFWTQNGLMAIVSAVIDDRFYDSFLGAANIFTRYDVPSVRENPLFWTDRQLEEMKLHLGLPPQTSMQDLAAAAAERQEFVRQALIERDAQQHIETRDLNMVGTITQDEPFIGYKDRPMENKVGIDSGWTINDVISMVNPVAPGDEVRGIYLDNTMTDEEFEAVAEGDPGPLAVFKEDKEVTPLAQYRIGVLASDQTLAKMLRLSMINQGVINIGRRFGRRLKVDSANTIAAHLETGNHPVTNLPYSITTTDTQFSSKVVDELIDTYQTEIVNRAIGKSKPLTQLRRNASVEFVSNNPHYVAPDTTFMDIGGVGAAIANCKIDSTALSSNFTDNDGYTFDVTSTLVLNVSPSLEMDAQTRDIAVGVVMRWLRTALSLWIPEPGKQSIRKVSHA